MWGGVGWGGGRGSKREWGGREGGKEERRVGGELRWKRKRQWRENMTRRKQMSGKKVSDELQDETLTTKHTNKQTNKNVGEYNHFIFTARKKH